VEQNGQGYLFSSDTVSEDLLVQRLDLGLLRSTAQDAGSRLDNSLLARATAAVASAAIVGVLIGHFL
jgi:hypothetical protein